MALPREPNAFANVKIKMFFKGVCLLSHISDLISSPKTELTYIELSLETKHEWIFKVKIWIDLKKIIIIDAETQSSADINVAMLKCLNFNNNKKVIKIYAITRKRDQPAKNNIKNANSSSLM